MRLGSFLGGNKLKFSLFGGVADFMYSIRFKWDRIVKMFETTKEFNGNRQI